MREHGGTQQIWSQQARHAHGDVSYVGGWFSAYVMPVNNVHPIYEVFQPASIRQLHLRRVQVLSLPLITEEELWAYSCIQLFAFRPSRNSFF